MGMHSKYQIMIFCDNIVETEVIPLSIFEY